MNRECSLCGAAFQVARAPGKRKPRVHLCSDECRLRQRSKGGEKRKRARYPCEVCGTTVKDRSARACSRKCGSVLATQSKMNNLTLEVCKYTAPSIRDFHRMLDIMHRKGYTQGDNEKSAYRYRIEEETLSIHYCDLPPSVDSDDWKACSAKEQQEHWNRVEQEAGQEGANLPRFKELPRGKEGWSSAAEKNLGWRTTNWGLQ